MQSKWWLSWLLAGVLLLAACNGQAAATQAVQPCLVGAWELSNSSASAFFNLTIPHGAFEPGSMKYLGGGGSVAYVFNEDGTFSLQISQAQVRYSIVSGSDLLDLKLTTQGIATSNYKINGDLIEAGPAGKSTISFVVMMGADEMMNTQKPEEFAPLFVPPYLKARFTCSADKLSLEVLDAPNSTDPIEFTRFNLPTPAPVSTDIPTP